MYAGRGVHNCPSSAGAGGRVGMSAVGADRWSLGLNVERSELLQEPSLSLTMTLALSIRASAQEPVRLDASVAAPFRRSLPATGRAGRDIDGRGASGRAPTRTRDPAPLPG